MILDESGEIADKIKIKTAYDSAEAIQRASIYRMLLELLALQTTLDGKIKPPPPISPNQCLILAEKTVDAFIRLCYKNDGKAVLTLPQTIRKEELKPNDQDKLQE